MDCVYCFKPVLHSCLKSDSSIISASVGHTPPSFFSKLLITSIDMVYACVKTGSNDTIIVWYGDGSVVYLQDKEHIILFSITIVTLFVLLYILIVTFGNYLLRWKRLHHFRSFIESFHGPYKHKLGYWFGVVNCCVHIYCIHSTERG